MIRTAAAAILPALLIAGCAMQPRAAAPVPQNAPVAEHMLQAPVAPPPAPVPGVIHIFHGVRVRAGTTSIDWTNASFAVSPAAAPTLSFFQTIAQSPTRFPCWLDVTVNLANTPPAVNDVGTFAVPAIQGINQVNGNWSIAYDNQPAGHWSIAKVTIGGTVQAPISGNAAGTLAGQVFQALTVAHTVAIVNGTDANGQPFADCAA